MKPLKSIAFALGSFLVFACGSNDALKHAPGDPDQQMAPYMQASAQYLADAREYRDAVYAVAGQNNADVVTQADDLVRMANAQHLAAGKMLRLMKAAIAQHQASTGTTTTKNTGGSGSGGSGSGGSSGDVTGDDDGIGDDDILTDDDINLADDDDDDPADDDVDPTPSPSASTDPSARPSASNCGCPSPSASGKPSKSGGGGKSGGGSGGGKSSGGGASKAGSTLEKLLQKLIQQLQKNAAAKQQSQQKAPSVPAGKLQTDLTEINKLLNDPNIKKWIEYGKT